MIRDEYSRGERERGVRERKRCSISLLSAGGLREFDRLSQSIDVFTLSDLLKSMGRGERVSPEVRERERTREQVNQGEQRLGGEFPEFSGEDGRQLL